MLLGMLKIQILMAKRCVIIITMYIAGLVKISNLVRTSAS